MSFNISQPVPHWVRDFSGYKTIFYGDLIIVNVVNVIKPPARGTSAHSGVNLF